MDGENAIITGADIRARFTEHVQGGKALNARNIIGIVVFLIVVYLVLHFLFHVI